PRRIGDRAHGGGVGARARPPEEARTPAPGGPGPPAVAVGGKPAREPRGGRPPAARQDGGDARAHGARPDLEPPLAPHEGGVADRDPLDVCEGVQRPGAALERDAQGAGAGTAPGGGASFRPAHFLPPSPPFQTRRCRSLAALKSPRLTQRVRLPRSPSATATVPHSFARASASPPWSKTAETIQLRLTSS